MVITEGCRVVVVTGVEPDVVDVSEGPCVADHQLQRGTAQAFANEGRKEPETQDFDIAFPVDQLPVADLLSILDEDDGRDRVGGEVGIPAFPVPVCTGGPVPLS